MSSRQLSNVQCGLPRTRKNYSADVLGTSNIYYGYKLREFDAPRLAAKHREPPPSSEISAQDKRQYEQFLKILEFETETNRKIREKGVRQRVQQDMCAYEEDLEARREKLRDLVAKEEMNLTREVVEEMQRNHDTRYEEMRARTEELRKRRDEEHEAMVAAKRMQQYIAACPRVKDMFSKRLVLDAKRCNVAQMADNVAKRSAEAELDALWHKVMLKELEAKKREEEEESTKRASAVRDVVCTRARQVADKQALVDERKRLKEIEKEQLKELWEEIRQVEQKQLEEEQQKRQELKRVLEQQVLSAKRYLTERARQEAAVDHAFKTLAEKELAAEKARMEEDIAIFRTEAFIYLRHLEDLRQEEAKRKLEVEALLRQSYEDDDARRLLALRKFKEARERNLQEMLRGRQEQLKEKQQAREEEQRVKLEEKRDLERQIETNANLDAIEREENRRKTLSYRRFLEEQWEEVEATRRRERQEDRRQKSTEVERMCTDEYQRLTDELVNASENITPHPFKVPLQQCAARHAAEREGRSYCPPALTSS